jgi:hypothetical protein
MAKPQKYVRKPFEVEVMRFSGGQKSAKEIIGWINREGEQAHWYGGGGAASFLEPERILVITDEGGYPAYVGEYVVKEGPYTFKTYTAGRFKELFEKPKEA